MSTATKQFVNGIDMEAFHAGRNEIAADPSKGQTRWMVTSRWKGGGRCDTHVKQFVIGGEVVDRDFVIRVDEPLQLCGTNQYPNPQETLQAALNSCLMMGYVAVCAAEGIELEDIRIDTEGEIDLRGFLGIDANVKPGYNSLKYTVTIKGNATAEQFERIHAIVTATSPNRFNLATAIPLQSRLVVR